MSLLNLKKSKPLAKPNLRTVEDFIDDALLYAQGKVSNKATPAVKNEIKSWMSYYKKGSGKKIKIPKSKFKRQLVKEKFHWFSYQKQWYSI